MRFQLSKQKGIKKVLNPTLKKPINIISINISNNTILCYRKSKFFGGAIDLTTYKNVTLVKSYPNPYLPGSSFGNH